MIVQAGDRRIGLRDDVVSTIIDDGAMLLDLRTKYFFSLNPSGAAILELIEAGATRQEVLDACTDWGMPIDQAPMVDAFLDALARDDLIEVGVDGGPASAAPLAGDWLPPSVEKQREPLQRIMASAFDPSLPLAE
jgi:hypothetical protein